MERKCKFRIIMVICLGFINMFSMCIVSVQANTAFMQNVQFRDTLCPGYVLKGRKRSVVDCGRTCASDVMCRAFFFGITSGDCYVSYTEVADIRLCVVTAGRFYEVVESNPTTTTSAPVAPTTLTTATQSTTTQLQTTAEASTTLTTAATTTTSTTTQAPVIFQAPCVSNANCLSTPNMSCIDLKCQCAAPTKYNSASSSCVLSCGSFGTTYTRFQNTVFYGTMIETVFTVASVSECKGLCSVRPLCAGFQFWSAINCKMKLESSTFNNVIGYDWHMRNCVIHNIFKIGQGEDYCNKKIVEPRDANNKLNKCKVAQ